MRILRRPPATCGIDDDSLLVGRIYNFPSELGSALLLDGYAELYDTLTLDEKRERSEEAVHVVWTAADKSKGWKISPRRRKKE